MKPDGSVIPHLYAAGEVAGTGMYGTQYPTCGTSIGSALFYGRIAGAPSPIRLCCNPPLTASQIRKRLRVKL